MKTKIDTYIQLYLNNTVLNISLTDDLKAQEFGLKNYGWIEITNGSLDGEICAWDNIPFFYQVSLKDFKDTCGDDLKRCGFGARKIWKDVNKLIKRAFKLNLLTKL